MELLKEANGSLVRTKKEKDEMITEAAHHYGAFLSSLGFDWREDENSENTPLRVAKAWVNDLIKGSVSAEPKITSFPNKGYKGMIVETHIPVRSMCSHHNLPIFGVAHVAYIPGKDGRMLGLSKFNRVVEYFAQRPQIQENLTQQIFDYLNTKCEENKGIAIMISCKHMCTCHRGVYHNSVMNTMEVSGYFFTNELGSKDEFLKHIELNGK